jgi:hypothetical protein
MIVQNNLSTKLFHAVNRFVWCPSCVAFERAAPHIVFSVAPRCVCGVANQRDRDVWRRSHGCHTSCYVCQPSLSARSSLICSALFLPPLPRLGTPPISPTQISLKSWWISTQLSVEFIPNPSLEVSSSNPFFSSNVLMDLVGVKP